MPKYSTTEYVAITGLVLAAYGAILSTVNSVLQYLGHKRENADVAIVVRPNMTTLGDYHGPYAGMVMTIITVANRGKRPLTIVGIAASQLDSRTHIVFGDIHPPLARLLAESESVTAYADEADGSLKWLHSIYTWDSANRKFSKHMAPLYRRIWSHIRRRFFPVQRIVPRPPRDEEGV
jgi:hypothetical protein